MFLSVRVQFLGVVGALLLLFAGCAPSNPRRELSGKILFKGVPLDQGTISFSPLGGGKPGIPTTKEGGLITKGE